MNRLKRVLTVVLLGALLVPVAVRAQEIAVVTISKGTVQMKAGEADAWADAGRGAMLSSGTLLLTGADGFAVIKFLDDKSSVKVMPNSGLKISVKGTGRALQKDLMLKVGSVFASVKKGKKKKFRIETATAVATVKGTQFWMTKQSAGSAVEQRIEVLKGVVGLNESFTAMMTLFNELKNAEAPEPGQLVAFLSAKKDMDARIPKVTARYRRLFADDTETVAGIAGFKKQLHGAVRAYGKVIKGAKNQDELLQTAETRLKAAGDALGALATAAAGKLAELQNELAELEGGDITKVICTEGVVEMFHSALKKKIDIAIGRTGTCTRETISEGKTGADDLALTEGNAGGDEQTADELKMKFRGKNGEKRNLNIKLKRK